VHDYGHIKIVTFHVEMNGSLSLTKAHEIADHLEDVIMKKHIIFQSFMLNQQEFMKTMSKSKIPVVLLTFHFIFT